MKKIKSFFFSLLWKIPFFRIGFNTGYDVGYNDAIKKVIEMAGGNSK